AIRIAGRSEGARESAPLRFRGRSLERVVARYVEQRLRPECRADRCRDALAALAGHAPRLAQLLRLAGRLVPLIHLAPLTVLRPATTARLASRPAPSPLPSRET